MLDRLLEWDRDTLIYLNNLGTENYDLFWITITSFYTWIPLFLTLIALIFWKNSSKVGLWMLLSYISMLVTLMVAVFAVKNITTRLRPNNDETINTLIRVVHEANNFSFFSGHAASSFSIAALAVLFLRKKFTLVHLAWLYPLLFSYSRIYLGVHYPIDIIVGGIVGVLLASIFYRLHQKFRAPYIM